MSTAIHLYKHLVENFRNYSTAELIDLNNEIVRSSGWGSSRGAFRTAIFNALSKRGIDLSRIICREDGFTTVLLAPVSLHNNALIPLI